MQVFARSSQPPPLPSADLGATAPWSAGKFQPTARGQAQYSPPGLAESVDSAFRSLPSAADRLPRPGSSASLEQDGVPGSIGRRTDGLSVVLPERPAAAGEAGTTLASHSRLIVDSDNLLQAGSVIGCVLETRLDSSLPGPARCMVTRDVYSQSGSKVLIGRGSTVIGEYHSGSALGMHRLFIMWTRLETTRGLLIDINSPAVDPLGGTGVPANVDEHWFDRIGAAFLLSVIQDGLTFAQNRATSPSEQSGVAIFPGTVNTGNQFAGKVLDSTINIPPTLSINQGARVAIFVTRDLYFSIPFDR